MRLERIEKEIHKKEAQLSELQNELKGLRAMKAQCEDAELLKMLHSMKLDKAELLRIVQKKRDNKDAAEAATNESEDKTYENE